MAGLSLFATAAQAEPLPFERWTGPPPTSFTLPAATGPDVSLEAARGSVTLVHFFATWCEPCREELPALARLAGRPGAPRVIVVSVAEPPPRVERFLATLPLPFPVLLDQDRAVAKNFRITTLPATIVLDAAHRPALVAPTDIAWDTISTAALTRAVSSAIDKP